MLAGSIQLSVITPVFRGAERIRECIQNVAENAPQSLEHLIVDNVSNDGTAELARELSKRWPHVRVISEPDRGQSDAMNKGIELARGRILGFLNVDDWYEPGVLQRVPDWFASLQEPSLLVGNCAVHDETGAVTGINQPSRSSLPDWLAGRPYPWNPSAYFYHRSVHDRIGGYDRNEHYLMDLDFLLRAAAVSHVQYVDEILGHFYFGPGTKTFSLGDGLHTRVASMRAECLASQPPLLRGRVALAQTMDRLAKTLHRLTNCRWIQTA